jgi:hypothetical protein
MQDLTLILQNRRCAWMQDLTLILLTFLPDLTLPFPRPSPGALEALCPSILKASSVDRAAECSSGRLTRRKRLLADRRGSAGGAPDFSAVIGTP